MKITPIFTGNKVNGKSKISGAVREQMNLWFKSLPDGQIDYIIRKHTNKVTHKQRGYYFLVVLGTIGDHFGYEKHEIHKLHDSMKLMFNPVKCRITGKIIGGSTKDMTTEEFFTNESSFVNRVRRWAAMEYGLNIRDPEKVE